MTTTATPVQHDTRDERIAHGKDARAEVPRSAHAEIDFPEDRDPVALLEEQAVSRVPELVPIRYGRMLASPFTFYRGGALIMAADLARTPTTSLRVQLCGDAHLSNFGVFASPERSLVFDLNDFDETAPGPWEWDVKRLAASFAIGGRENGFDGKQRLAVVLDTVRAYREAMHEFAAMHDLDVWYSQLPIERVVSDFTAGIDAKRLKKAEAFAAKSRTKDSMQAFEKLTHLVDGEPRIISEPPLIVPIEELMTESESEAFEGSMRTLIRGYRRTLETDRRHLLEQFRFVHLARKVVGVGSVGTRCYIALFAGPAGGPLILQVKEARESVLAPYVRGRRWRHEGERVVTGQRIMQAVSDSFLGWTKSPTSGTEYYVRQLHDMKYGVDIAGLREPGMRLYAEVCAWALARAHARSGNPAEIAGYLGPGGAFDKAIATFAVAYADQTERDFAALAAAVRAGRLPAETGI
jgi:uncharacterized protein (DUF2252 family)